MDKSYRNINDELKKIISMIKVSKCITPINDSCERKKFLDAYSKKIVYNPKYTYAKTPRSIIAAKVMLLRLKRDIRDAMQEALAKKLLLLIEFLENIKDDKKQVYTNGRPDPKMVSLAKITISNEREEIQKRTVSAKDAKKVFREYLFGYGIKDWKVAVKKKMIAKSNVNSSKKTVFIKQRRYSLHEINNLISHEIEVHVLRSVNGQKNKNVLFSLGTADYLKTEEGLAIMMEQLSGNYNPIRFKFFAARIIAADLAVTKSFYEVFDALHKRYHLSRHNAYIITKRVKRGLIDTKNPGGYIKDHVYFEGFCMIRKFMQEGGDIRPLFAGKISLLELSLVKNESLNTDEIIIPKAVQAHYQYLSKQKVFY
jgi:uncharacterized protein (TIGR02421 family)